MFLHAGASLHGHEYSSRRPSPLPPQRPNSFLRSTFRPLSEGDPRTFAPAGIPRAASVERPRFEEAPTPIAAPPLKRRPISDAVTRRELSVRFDEPHAIQPVTTASAPISEDEDSVAGSEVSDVTESSARRRRPRRAPRQSDCFALAHPAPQLRTKQRRLVQIRPRLLLQLQRLGDRRAVPAFDVVPSGLLAGSLIIPKLAKRFPRMFGQKPELGQNDLLVVRSEDYGLGHAEGTEIESTVGAGLDHRDVLAAVSPMPCNQRAEIVMEDGSAWQASPLGNGSYEFVSTDPAGHATVARWVKRSSTRRRSSSVSSVGPAPQAPEAKWTFSLIDPATRRHPIMGIMKPNMLEVFDSYSSMSTSSSRFPPSRPFGGNLGAADSASSASGTEGRTTVRVLEQHKKLMLVTAIWICLKESGWPASANPKLTRSGSHCRSSSVGAVEDFRAGPDPVSRRSSVSPPDVSGRQPHNRDLPGTSTFSCKTTERRTPGSPSPPRRTQSTGAAYMQKRRSTQIAVGEEKELEVGQKQFESSEEETHTCWHRVRHWTNRLFHRRRESSYQEVQAGDLGVAENIWTRPQR